MKQNTVISTARELISKGLFVVESRTVADLYCLSKSKTSQLLKRMENAGLAARVERGKYILLGLNPEQVLSNPLSIGSRLVTPSYISFWSALHFYGMTEQAPRVTYVATTRRKKELRLRQHRFEFVSLQPKAFFGYRREIYAGLPVTLADEAKAILDSLCLPRYAGGLPHVAAALLNGYLNHLIDTTILVDYANRLERSGLNSRLGFLLDHFGLPFTGLEPPKGPISLDPHSPRRGNFNRQWKVYINMDMGQVVAQGVG